MTTASDKTATQSPALVKWLLISGALMTGCAPAADTREAVISSPAGIVHGKSIKSSDLGKSAPATSTVALVVQDADDEEALCTGTLLDESTVLTAAHCVDHDPTSIKIVFGTIVKKTSADHQRRALGFMQHSDWRANKPEGRADLAVIHFLGGLPDGYRPVRLASDALKIDKGLPTHVLGYGVTSGITERGSGVLREGETSVLGQHSVSETVTDGRSISVCFGDSGGPAFALENDEIVQWGVASAVSNHACNSVALHTVTSYYRQWIAHASKELAQKVASRHDQSRHGKRAAQPHLNYKDLDSETFRTKVFFTK